MPETVGLKLGSKGVQVERMQAYLGKFGYLESPVVDDFSVRSRLIDLPSAKKGDFDENTEVALRRFQEFNHLQITGTLDQATLTLMEKPRCGFPDLSEYAATDNGLAEYTTTGRKWPSTNLTYGFQEFTPDIPSSQAIQAFEQALALWAAETPLRFTRVAISSNPTIVVRFVAGNHGDGNPFDGPGGVLAHAYYPPVTGQPPTAIQGDAHFDEAEKWTITIPVPAGTIDLVSVAAHEIGHSLGLAHSNVTGSLMYPYYGGPHRFLHKDDISGIKAIYGSYKLAHAMWIHGTSIDSELPDQIESMRRYGFYTRIIGKANSSNWLHFAIPTPVIVDQDRKTIGNVMLRFRTSSDKAIVREVHIYDGEQKIASHLGLNMSGNHFFERFGVAHKPEVQWGVGISIGVTFSLGTASQRSMDFIAAGCDFLP